MYHLSNLLFFVTSIRWTLW